MCKNIAKNLGLAGTILIFLTVAATGTVFAQDEGLLAPPEIPGEAIYIPFPVPITLDGKLSDWAGVPTVTVTKGPMTSPDPAENGSFTFAVAADMKNLYITMSMPDKNIVAGKHETSFWNEDSFEFYVNASGDLYATTYGNKIFQININAADIGNTNPDALTITGMDGSSHGVRGFVFKTADGWGFEAALPLTGLLEPSHGLEIGFQAQANGASKLDRDVKLIWSNADTDDTSWINPSVFGRALFFEVGQTEIPLPSKPTPTPLPTPTPKPTATPSPTATPKPSPPPPTPTPKPEATKEPTPTPAGGGSGAQPGDSTWIIVVAILGVAAAAGVAFWLWRRRGQ